jgi:hypothetical protein
MVSLVNSLPLPFAGAQVNCEQEILEHRRVHPISCKDECSSLVIRSRYLIRRSGYLLKSDGSSTQLLRKLSWNVCHSNAASLRRGLVTPAVALKRAVQLSYCADPWSGYRRIDIRFITLIFRFGS